jgi:hypothetical protein
MNIIRKQGKNPAQPDIRKKNQAKCEIKIDSDQLPEADLFSNLFRLVSASSDSDRTVSSRPTELRSRRERSKSITEHCTITKAINSQVYVRKIQDVHI